MTTKPKRRPTDYARTPHNRLSLYPPIQAWESLATAFRQLVDAVRADGKTVTTQASTPPTGVAPWHNWLVLRRAIEMRVSMKHCSDPDYTVSPKIGWDDWTSYLKQQMLAR